MGGLSGRRWAVVAAASGTVLIGGGAFWLSFVALADLAVRSGITRNQAWIWPLLVDGLIVVATVAVVALDGHRAAWYPWVLLIAGALMSVSANAAHALVAAYASVPGLLAAIVAAVPPLVLLASTHLTTVLTRSTRTPVPTPITPTPESGSALEVSETAGAQAQAAPLLLPELPERPRSATGIAVATPPAPAAKVLGEQTEPDRSDVPVLEAVAETPSAEPDPPTLAGAGRRERAAVLRGRGWSNKAIARELGVHASTVGRWFPRTDPAPAADQETSAVPEHHNESDEEKEQKS